MDDSTSCRELADWLVLIRTPGISPVQFQALLMGFGSVAAIMQADRSALADFGLKPATVDGLQRPDLKRLEADLVWLQAPANHFINCLDPIFPSRLKQIPDPPIGLFVSGNLSVLNAVQIAIVGSRKPTPGGRRLATDFSRELGLCGITITSGMATGIDSAAHQGALDAGTATIAVLGNGVDIVYPKGNHSLAKRIIENGALVSEFPLATRPLPAHFPRRNRIISGLSSGTLVIEAALKSGSLITARMALEQGREVFAVPGSIHNPLARGCHQLLRDGAKLTENIRDILEETAELASLTAQLVDNTLTPRGFNERLDDDAKLLLDNIGYEPVTMDSLIEKTGISANVTAAVLMNLELQDLIESLPGGSYVRKSTGIPDRI